MAAFSSASQRSREERFNTKLAEVVQNFPIIYDQFLPAHSNKNAVEQAWQSVARMMETPADVCRKSWRNARNSYSRYLRTKPPSGSAANARRPYYLSDVLAYLKPFCAPREQISNLQPVADSRQVFDVLVTPAPDIVDEPETNVLNLEEAYPLDFSMTVSEDSFPVYTESAEASTSTASAGLSHKEKPKKNDFSASQMYPSLKPRKGKNNQSVDDLVKDYFSQKATSVKRKEQAEDEFVSFIKGLVPHMKDFSDGQKRKVKKRILEVICDIADENDAAEAAKKAGAAT